VWWYDRHVGRCWIVLLVCAGCNQILGVNDITLGDGGTSGGDGSAATMCITGAGSGALFTPCFATLPTMDVVLGGTIDTDTSNLCSVQHQPGGPDVCVVAGNTLTVRQNFLATGSRPLVLAAVTDLTVMAMLDVSGGGTGKAAGANSGDCLGGAPGGDDAQSPGGGGGGALGAVSASGGAGFAGATAGAGTGLISTPAFVRGGCDGKKGGAKGSTAGGAGGTAGGALYLIAGNSIDVMGAGTIAAPGGGGAGGTGGGGGGGGGASGGLVGLDSPGVFVEGTIYANGGGGGGGAGIGGGASPGQTGTLGNSSGGSPSGGGGMGGNGGVGTSGAGPGSMPASNDCGAGGGGGSIGIVWMNYMTAGISGSISPDETGP